MQSCNHSIKSGDELSKNYTSLVGSTVIAVDPSYYGPTEVNLLIGNPAKAKDKLGWDAKTYLNELLRLRLMGI